MRCWAELIATLMCPKVNEPVVMGVLGGESIILLLDHLFRKPLSRFEPSVSSGLILGSYSFMGSIDEESYHNYYRCLARYPAAILNVSTGSDHAQLQGQLKTIYSILFV